MKCVTRWRKHFRHLSWGVYAAGCRNPNSEVGKLIAMVIAVEKGDRKIVQAAGRAREAPHRVPKRDIRADI